MIQICAFVKVALLNLITISSTWARVIDVMDNEVRVHHFCCSMGYPVHI